VTSTDELLQTARSMLHERFRIEHCTLQIERTHLEDTHCS
jgi:cobalt-zinc-cadmium efflux system protein